MHYRPLVRKQDFCRAGGSVRQTRSVVGCATATQADLRAGPHHGSAALRQYQTTFASTFGKIAGAWPLVSPEQQPMSRALVARLLASEAARRS